MDILNYTYNPESKFANALNEKYNRDLEKVSYYIGSEIKPSFKTNDYNGFDNYLAYMWDTYGKEETFLGYVTELLKVREHAENLGYTISEDSLNKNFTDYINQIRQYGDIRYAMEEDSVGIVRNLNVAAAMLGAITTNINNFGGKETKMGIISNSMYANTLYRAAHFNSLRRTKYITPELEKVYGNNLNNVYNLSSLFLIDRETGRYPEVDSESYIAQEVHPSIKEPYVYETNNYVLPKNSFGKNILYGYSEGQTQQYDFYNQSLTHENNRYVDVDNVSSIDAVKTIDEISGDLLDSSLIKKTNKFLKERKINTVLSRFYDSENESSLIQSAVSRFGISHGRNLLTKKAHDGISSVINGYENPYCRVWTNHHQFSKMKHLIRPFIDDEAFMGIEDIQASYVESRPNKGAKYLADNTVLNKNGMVNITPVNSEENIISPKESVKKCMFSIENLAWKDVLVNQGGSYRKNGNEITKLQGVTLSQEQQGPNGGRIMWFPPYDLTFQENANANWNKSEFIGRGEPVYTYSNASRNGTLTFKMLVDHPSVLDYWVANKKNMDDSDEQKALRFFAGCEPIDVFDNAFKVKDGIVKTNGETKDIQLIENDREFSFYVFYPNNFSGQDIADKNKVMEILFKGNAAGEVSNELFYGYEMGTSPISTIFTTSSQQFIIESNISEENKIKIDGSNKAELKLCVENGDTYEWQYPIDEFKEGGKLVKDEKLAKCENYSDNKSFGLNSTFDVVKELIGSDDTISCSFGEFFAVASNDTKNIDYIKKCEEAVLKRKYGENSTEVTKKMEEMDERLKELELLLRPTPMGNTTDKVILDIKVYSTATVDGDSSGNKKLSEERGKSLKGYLEKLQFFKDKTVKIDETKSSSNKQVSNDNDVSSSINKIGKFAKVTFTIGSKAVLDNREKDAKKKDENEKDNGKIYKTLSTRYDDEYRFFSMLKENDNLAYNRLVDKIKYFSPAFHSLTPEGFNSRLTFLHQCTRQGPTCSASDMKSPTVAANLAFGRAPFCILRVGDFLNTKIVINSVSITYPESMWDLNPEGIGVQFMFAEVSLNIDILGGSDLGAPIKRLQNAVSFNYYANTSVYDDRSDRARYVKGTDSIESVHEWHPDINNR